MQMLMERVSGKSIPDLAAQYNLPRRDVEALTQEGWETAVVESLKAQMMERLSTMVLAVYEQQLRMGSLEAARDIAMSIGLLRKEKSLTIKAPVIQEKIVSSVEDYRLARQSRKYKAPELLEDSMPPVGSPRKISVE